MHNPVIGRGYSLPEEGYLGVPAVETLQMLVCTSWRLAGGEAHDFDTSVHKLD